MDNPVASITNQLKVDVEIFDVYNTSSDPKEPSYQYTSLGSVAAGKTANIQTKHFSSQLQGMVSGKIQELDEKYYHNFPVSVFAITPLGKLTSHAIVADEQTGMLQALQFIKYTTANGNSVLAQHFLKALKSDTNQMNAVDSFFATTGSFKLCTFHAWTAMMAYLNNFTSPWQGGYYFYTNPQSSSDEVKLMAILSITSDANSNDAVMTMANSDKTIPADNAQTTALKVNDGGTFTEANVGVGNISVDLKALWMNVITRDLTIKGIAPTINTRYLIGPAFTGTVNGVKVVGTRQMRELPRSQAEQMQEKERQQAEAEREKQFDRMWSKVISIVGLTINMFMLFVMVKQMKQGEGAKSSKVANDAARNGNVDDSEVRQSQSRVEQEYQSDVDSELAPDVDSVSSEMASLPQAESELSLAMRTNAAETMLNGQIEQLQEVLESQPPTEALESTAEDLFNAQQELAGGEVEKAQSLLEKTGTEVDTALESSGSGAEKYETDALTEVKDALAEDAEVRSSLEQAQAEQQAQNESDPAEELDPDAFDDPASDPIEDFPIGGGE